MEPFPKDQPPSTSTITTAAALSSSLPVDINKAVRKMKPYGCVLCKRSFGKAMNLQKHLMEVHGVTEESDDDDDDDDDAEEEDYRDDAGCIQSQHDDGINLIADAAAGERGEISGDGRDAEEAPSCSQPTENSHRDPLSNFDQPGTESTLHGDGNDVAVQEQTTATLQTALQVNPSDIIAQAAAGANILMGEKDSDEQEEPRKTKTQISAEKEDLSKEPQHVGIVKDTPTLFVDPSAQVHTSTCLEDSVIVQTDEEQSQFNEMIPQIFPVSLHRTTYFLNKGPPSRSGTKESSQTPVAIDDSCIADCVVGEVQNKNLQEKKTLSSARRGISCQAVTSNSKTLRSGKRTLHQSVQASDHAKRQDLGTDQRPQLRRSGRSAKKKIDENFLMESVEGKKKQMKKQKNEKKREEEEEQKKEEQEKRGKKQKKRKEEQKSEELKRPRRELPEKPPECSAVTRRKRKTLEEKLADLHRGHEETEKLNILVQEIISDRPGGKMEAKDLSPSRLKRRKSSPPTKTKSNLTMSKSTFTKNMSNSTRSKTKKTFDCISCQEKFPSLSECIDHMRRAHLSPKHSPMESEESYSSVMSFALEEEQEEEEEKEDVEEIPNTGRGSNPTKGIQRRKGSNRVEQYSCEYCSEVSKSLEGQKVHMSVHCGLVDRKCFKCQIYDSRPSAAQLEDIERSVEKVRDATNAESYEHKRGKQLLVQFHQCILCNSCFAVEKHLRNHMSQHEVIICQVCNGVFSSAKALGKHVPHHRTGPLSCKTCGQTFFSSYMLLVHMRGHTNDYRCKHCDATFMFPANLSRHIKQLHTDNKNGDRGSADMVASQEQRTSKHKDRTRGTKDNPKFSCRFCGNLHFFENTLKRHIEKFHPESVENRGNFVCELCGAVKHKFSQLRNHMICHEQPKQKCPLCSKVFVRISSLKQHIHQVHEGRKDFTCQYCGKRISSFVSLQDHERLHTGEKPFVCSECGKSFRLRQMYKVHLRREHFKDKSFRCLQCGKCFFSRSSLAKHKNIHAPNEDSVCPDCGKRFKRKDLLRIHLVQHRQAVQCLKCNRRFSSEVALKYHMNKLHKINLYRTNYLSEGLLHMQQSQMSTVVADLSSVADAPCGLTSDSSAAENNTISVTVTKRNSKVYLVDASGNSGNGILPTQTAPEPANNLPLPYGTDRRLSDPTNVAISTILSQLMHTSVPE